MQKQRNAKPFLKEFHVIVQAFVAILKVIETIFEVILAGGLNHPP